MYLTHTHTHTHKVWCLWLKTVFKEFLFFKPVTFLWGGGGTASKFLTMKK
jgi:hypothetical protein